MGRVVLCSASGAPGVTVTGLGLTLTWPRDVMLVDADRTPSQAVLAGYLRGRCGHGLGLPGLLQVHRERYSLMDALVPHSVSLPEPEARRADSPTRVSRRFLPGFVNLGSVEIFGSAWRELGRALADAPFDAIVDAGRLGTHGLPAELADADSAVALVCRTSLVSLAGARLYLAPLLEQVPPDRVGLILVGPGRPYRAHEVAAQFDVEVIAEVAWDPSGAGDLHEGRPLGRQWRRGRLARSYAAAASSLAKRLDAERPSIGAPA